MRHIFIINPTAGKIDISVKMRREIEALCAKYNIDPLICISEYPGYEREMTKKMCSLFSNEQIRFYSIGGSGTLFQIISGINDFSNVEVACCAQGLTNDLLKCYGKNIQPFRSIEELINGKIQMLDLIEVADSKAVDFVYFGLGTTYFNDITFYQLTSLIDPLLSYTINIISDIVRNKWYDYEIYIDGKDYSGKYSLVACFNGFCMGGNVIPLPYARPNDGYLDFILIDAMPSLMQLFKLKAYSKGDLDRLGSCAHIVRGKKLVVARKDKSIVSLNCDGECVRSPERYVTMQLIPNCLKFVVPQSAEILPVEETPDIIQ